MPATSDIIALEIGQSLLPLGQIRGPLGSQAMLHFLGWEPPPAGTIDFATLDFGDLHAKIEAALDARIDVELGGDGGSLDLSFAAAGVAVVEAAARLKSFADALQGLPQDYLARTNIVADFVPRLLGFLIDRHLELNHPVLHNALVMLGLLEQRIFEPDPTEYRTDHIRSTFRFDRLGAVLGNPSQLFAELFGWGTPNFNVSALMNVVAGLFQALGADFKFRTLDAFDESLLLGRPVAEPLENPLPQFFLRFPGAQGEGGIMLGGVRADAGLGGGIILGPSRMGTDAGLFPIDESWQFGIESRFSSPPQPDDPAGLGAIMLRPGVPPRLIADLRSFQQGNIATDRIGLSLKYTPDAENLTPLVTLFGGTGLSFKTVGAGIGLRSGGAAAEFYTEIAIEGGRFALDLSGLSPLLAAIIPKDAIRADFDAALGWANGRAYLRGSTALRVRVPVDLLIGPVKLEAISLALAPGQDGGLPIEATADLRAAFGPLSALVQQIGITARFDWRDGNAGPVNVEVTFRPPSGIGISLDSGPVSGGGYLAIDPDGRRFGGALKFKLSFVQVGAFGIYEEAPGAGASFLAVLGIQFLPGIQLGFGFALTGVGGLIGINRRANLDLLRERLSSGAAGNLLFPTDPVGNAPALIADLAGFFPPEPSSFVVGPTLQISWLSPIVRLDVALAIELPGPSKIIVLGTLRAMIGIGESTALVFLRMDFLGAVDFGKSLVSFDAFLVASHALGIFRLSGGMAFRLNYGPNSYLLLSIGGFHRRFDPGPLDMPKLPRVGASLDAAFIVRLYLRLEFYIASTSNTLQTGAYVEAGLKLGPVQARGHFRFDALIQFRPFRFDIEFSGGFDIKAIGISLANVDVEGRISGPGPVVIFARFSVKRLFVEVSGSGTFRLGSDNADRVDPVPSLVQALSGELGRIENLRTSGEDASVRLLPNRSPPPSGEIVVSPKGSLIWEQKRAPLRTIVDRFEGVAMAGRHQVAVSGPAGWEISPETDWFSPGSFTTLDLTASQSMNNAAFAELESGMGLKVSPLSRAPTAVTKDIVIDIVKRPSGTRFSNVAMSPYVNAALAAALQDGAHSPAVDGGPARVSVRPETAQVVGANGAVSASQQTPFQAFQLSRNQASAFAVPSADLAIAF